jgi:hypothetical protein
MTLTTDGYLGPLAGMLDRSEIEAVPSRRFTYLDRNRDGVLGEQGRMAVHSAKGKGATFVDGRA